MLKNKRASVPIVIGILVLLTLTLVISSLFYFYITKGKIDVKVGNSLVVENVLVKEDSINYIIQEVVDNSFEGASSKEDVKANFVLELNKYVNNGIPGRYVFPELSQLESQLDEGINFDRGEIVLDVNIIEESNKEFIVEYKYKKTFIKK